VLDRLGYGIERCLALTGGEPDLEDAVLARQHHRFSELRSNCRIRSSLGSLRPGSRARTFKLQQESRGTDCKQADQATCLERVPECGFVHGESPGLATFKMRRKSAATRDWRPLIR